MDKYAFYVYDCGEELLQEYLATAKSVANIVHHTVTVHTTTRIYEVHEDEEEEKEAVVEQPEEKPESW